MVRYFPAHSENQIIAVTRILFGGRHKIIEFDCKEYFESVPKYFITFRYSLVSNNSSEIKL